MLSFVAPFEIQTKFLENLAFRFFQFVKLLLESEDIPYILLASPFTECAYSA